MESSNKHFYKKIDFSGAADGSYPDTGGLALNGGKFLGMAQSGGANNMGVIFEFVDTYTLTYSFGAGGSIAGSSPQSVDGGSSGTAVTATPDTGYSFVDWSDASTTNPRTDTNVAGDMSVTANFAISTYTVNYLAGLNGSVTGSSTQVVDYASSTLAVTATPNSGYRFVNWSDASTDNPRTDLNVTGNFSVTANFELIPVAVTTSGGCNGPILLGPVYELGLPSVVKPRTQTIYPDGTIVYQEETATTTVVFTNRYKFTRDLKIGMKGEDVKELQKFLNNHNFAISVSGGGSPGKETNYFGSATKAALTKFQKTKNINPAQGYLGLLTRGVVNGL